MITIKEIVISTQGGDYGRPRGQRVHNWKVMEVIKASPLDIAREKNHGEMCELLLERHAKTTNATLNYAVHNSNFGTPRIIEMIIKNGARVNATDSIGWTVLHYATQMGNLPAVKALIENGADPDATYFVRKGIGRKKMKAVDLARKKGHEDIVAFLAPRTGLRGNLRTWRRH